MAMLASLALRMSARRWLHTLHDDIGVAGLAAAAAIPGISAILDQHIAAVHDATTLGLELTAATAGAVLLAQYGRGVLEVARGHGWHPPPADLNSWRAADWTSLRLTAVTALAHRPALAPNLLPPLNGQEHL